MTSQLEKTHQALMALLTADGRKVTDIAIRDDGATHYCTVTLGDRSKWFYVVRHEMTITPTNANWETFRGKVS